MLRCGYAVLIDGHDGGALRSEREMTDLAGDVGAVGVKGAGHQLTSVALRDAGVADVGRRGDGGLLRELATVGGLIVGVDGIIGGGAGVDAVGLPRTTLVTLGCTKIGSGLLLAPPPLATT